MKALLTFTFVFLSFMSSGQHHDSIRLIPMERIEWPFISDKAGIVTSSSEQDSICALKEKEFAHAVVLFKNQFDSLGLIVKALNERNQGSLYYYYLSFQTTGYIFPWNPCTRWKQDRSSHVYAINEVDINIKKEEKFRLNLEFSTGQTFYFEDFKQSAK